MAKLAYLRLRLWAMLKKEFIHLRRDLTTYAILVILPVVEVIVFGYMINTDAKVLPTVVVAHDYSQFTNSLIQTFKNTGYFSINRITDNDIEAEKLLDSNKAQFIITIPPNFSNDLIKKQRPHLLLEGDATDPVAVSNAFHTVNSIINKALEDELKGNLSYLGLKNPSFTIDVQAKYNPAIVAKFHTLPGLIGIMLFNTLVMLTAISITSEREDGTMEMLLVTPLRPLEVIIGKIMPHIVLAYIIFFVSIALSYWMFKVPFQGSVLLFTIITLPFIIAHLGIGIMISTIAKTQFQAANIGSTYILPAILFSGFLFPFFAMPLWAQWLGELLPPTHYLRISLAIMLKGAGFVDIWQDLWPIIAFMLVAIFLSLKYYRKTLD